MRKPGYAASVTSAPDSRKSPRARPSSTSIAEIPFSAICSCCSVTSTPRRAEVVELCRAHYEHDLRNDGPMPAAAEALVERIHKGGRLVPTCRCWPKRWC